MALRTVSLRDDLQVALEEQGSAEADFSESERTILTNVLKLGTVSVGDVMVERSDIQAVESDINLGSLIARFRDVRHSRLPVYDDGLDNILGFIHVKDALAKITEPVTDPEKEVPVKLVSTVLKQKLGKLDIIRDAMFVPTFMPVGDLLQSMRASRVHMAIVVDEYGGTDGLVTIEDLLEAVVGEIEDEHDELAAALIRKVGTDTYIADARAELSDVRAMLGPEFDPGEYAEDVDTIGGLVFDLAGHVPKRGERVTKLDGFEFEVLAADSRRIKRLRIRRKVEGSAETLAITDQRTDAQKAAAE
ncbi:hemolysin [Devosia epidermidihirudinis]|uniref:Hemolysin n=1 Tax=Devosia epidermidihirudinis TaxID=1293439 RepID=A0A0F5Q9V4_9HYPH|nr:hemolysin family protein [Devosia epidermidihirudinis]KKC37762.1 hemolysin [Devosia epidermidihirudinis]